MIGDIEIILEPGWFATCSDPQIDRIVYEYVDEYFYDRDLR